MASLACSSNFSTISDQFPRFDLADHLGVLGIGGHYLFQFFERCPLIEEFLVQDPSAFPQKPGLALGVLDKHVFDFHYSTRGAVAPGAK